MRHFITLFNYQKEDCSQVGGGFLQVRGNRTRESGLKLHQRKFNWILEFFFLGKSCKI